MTATTPPLAPRVIGELPPGTCEALIIWASRCQRGNGHGRCPRVDLLFVGSDGHIIECVRQVNPSRLAPASEEANLVIELPEGTLDRSGTQIGDYIEFS